MMFYVIGSEESKSGSASYSSRQQNQRRGGAVRNFRCTDTVSDEPTNYVSIWSNISIQLLCSGVPLCHAEAPYLSVQRAWHSEHNRPVISSDLKTKSARRDIPLPSVLTECLREAKEVATSEYVVANRDGDPLSYTQFKRVWQYIVTRSTKERTYVRYINGQKIQRTVTPKLGEKAAHNGNVVYTLDFQVTPHQLRHTYITNLIYSGADPKTVQYLAGHKHSKITMDIYAKVKYNKPKELSSVVNKAFAPQKGATPE